MSYRHVLFRPGTDAVFDDVWDGWLAEYTPFSQVTIYAQFGVVTCTQRRFNDYLIRALDDQLETFVADYHDHNSDQTLLQIQNEVKLRILEDCPHDTIPDWMKK